MKESYTVIIDKLIQKLNFPNDDLSQKETKYSDGTEEIETHINSKDSHKIIYKDRENNNYELILDENGNRTYFSHYRGNKKIISIHYNYCDNGVIGKVSFYDNDRNERSIISHIDMYDKLFKENN